MPNTKKVEIETEAIHNWFSLSYGNYLVIQRSLLQSMPDEWQNRFVKCLEELYDRAEKENLDIPTEFWVRATKNNKFIRDDYSNYERGRRYVFKK